MMLEINYNIVMLLFTVTVIVMIMVSFAIIFTVIHQKRRQQLELQNQIIRNQFDEQLLRSQLEIREQTLTQVSRELHDNLGQMSKFIETNLYILEKGEIKEFRRAHRIALSPLPPRSVSVIPEKEDRKNLSSPLARELEYSRERLKMYRDSHQLIARLMRDVRDMSIGLGHNTIEREGLPGAIANDVQRINRSDKMTATFHLDPDLKQINPQYAIIVYRMTQEIINNSLKHSSASHIDLSLANVPGHIELRISDNGIGFDGGSTGSRDGAGLTNLRERAKLIQARLDIISSPGNGTTIVIQIPI
jgi:signal transduction histidine kinase